MMKRYSSVVFGLVILLVASTSWGQEVSDRWQVVHAGTLLSSPGQPPLQNQSLIIKNDRIDRIVSGFATSESLALDTAETIDLREYFVLPGLIDMHVHLTSERGTSLPGVEAGRDVYSMTLGIRNARKTLYAGYTTVRNPGSSGWSIFALRDGIEAGDIEGPRAGENFEIP